MLGAAGMTTTTGGMDSVSAASVCPIGIALLGFAHPHQRGWAASFQESRHVRVACAWDDNQERGEAAAAALGVPFDADLDAVLGRDDVQAVTICSTNDTHADLAVAAAQAGKDIMVQKPMATTLADCDRIVAAVEAAGVRYYQSHNLRFDPVHQEIKRLVAAGEVGRIATVRRRHSHAFALLQPAVLDWMQDPVRGGGGAFMDEGAHVALWFLWMFGMPEAVTGFVSTRLTEQHPGVEDGGVLLYRYASGMIGIHQSSWVELASTSTVEISGDRGVIVATGTDITAARSMSGDEPPLRIWRHDPGGPAAGAGPAASGQPNPAGHWEYPQVALPRSRLQGTAEAFIRMLVEEHAFTGRCVHGPHRRRDGAGRLSVVARGAHGGAVLAALGGVWDSPPAPLHHVEGERWLAPLWSPRSAGGRGLRRRPR